jgi:hypothetical protein
LPIYSASNDARKRASGFPIRKSSDQRLFATSPRHIAGYNVLHRLQLPRHPPYALIHLTIYLNSLTTTVRIYRRILRSNIHHKIDLYKVVICGCIFQNYHLSTLLKNLYWCYQYTWQKTTRRQKTSSQELQILSARADCKLALD